MISFREFQRRKRASAEWAHRGELELANKERNANRQKGVGHNERMGTEDGSARSGSPEAVQRG